MCIATRRDLRRLRLARAGLSFLVSNPQPAELVLIIDFVCAYEGKLTIGVDFQLSKDTYKRWAMGSDGKALVSEFLSL